jgi:hypothetical protein
MNTDSKSSNVNDLFEAVLDTDRLSLIAHLSQEELTLSELSNQSDIPPKDIQRHISILVGANLVKMRDHDGRQVYRFNPKQIELIKRQQFARPKNDVELDSLGFSKETKKILADYTNQDGTLKMIPTKGKKIVAVLDYLILSFEKDIEFSERQVNDILRSYFPDPTTLRRYLIDFGYLGRSRNGAHYWRIETQDSDEGIS